MSKQKPKNAWSTVVRLTTYDEMRARIAELEAAASRARELGEKEFGKLVHDYGAISETVGIEDERKAWVSDRRVGQQREARDIPDSERRIRNATPSCTECGLSARDELAGH